MQGTVQRGKNFWDTAWDSEQLAKGAEMLDVEIPHHSILFSYGVLGELQGKKLLDIGCGSGILSIDLAKKGASVTGIDLSERGITIAKERAKKERVDLVVKQMSAEALEFKDNTFDIVYISRMLAHTSKDKVLEESLRVLKKEGILVLTEPLRHWLFGFLYRPFSPYRHSKPVYFTIRDVKEMQHKEFYLFSTFFFFLFFINKKIAFAVFNTVAKIDEVILNLFPILGNLAWLTVAWVKK